VTIRLARSLININSNASVNVYATESSYIMKDRLREKNFTVINDIRELENVHLISCLNVLDRCSEPKALLQDIFHALHPNGKAILALVIPYNHYVERSKDLLNKLLIKFNIVFILFLKSRFFPHAFRTLITSLAVKIV
jgi:2-polyprenyl-3-methyl-5-hydroxy-6-metoxy-1,4-benzoquinol methylase